MKTITNISQLLLKFKISSFTSLLLLCLGWQQQTLAQVYIGDITLNSQADVNHFQKNYNSTSIIGSLSIEGANIIDLSPLAAIHTVEGVLSISNNKRLTSLNGLNNLLHVNSDLFIHNNPSLTDLSGMNALTSVDGYLYIRENRKLTNVDGLSALQWVGGLLSIYHNPLLTNLNGLGSLTSVGSYLSIINNDKLSNLDGLDALTYIGEGLAIKHNDGLINLEGLSSLASINGYLYIQQNPLLKECCGINTLLSTPDAVKGPIAISDNDTPCDSKVLVRYFCELPQKDTADISDDNAATFDDRPQNQQPGMLLYPNPSSTTINVKWDAPNASGTIQLIDMIGRVVIEQALMASNKLQVFQIKPGSYTVRVKAKGFLPQLERVVVDH